MTKRCLTVTLSIFFIVLGAGSMTGSLSAQNNNAEEIEVYLDFRHRGVINSVIISYYKNDEFYLPVAELFSLFNIDHTVNGLIIDGRFGLEQIPYRINFQSGEIWFGDELIEITAEDYILREIDSYLRADIFYQAFGLDFTIDFNNLSLNLETERELPAIQQAIRRQRRQVADQNRLEQENYPLRYGRERPFLDGGFVDYNLSATLNSNQNVYNFNTNLGLQIYGGDLQGAIFGSYSENFSNLATDNLRWRYMYRDQPWLTKLTLGQTTTDGFARNAYTGIRLSNEPIEPRRLFDEFVVQGSTIPQSEVELYLNNALIDFQQADELGNYRFLTPVSYGSSQLDLRIYGPTGQIIERSERLLVPFTFQPSGVFNYTVNAGRLDNPIFGQTTQNLTAQGTGAYGITDWLTAKAGVEYYEGYHETLPTFTASLSSRIKSNYILTLEAASEAYYRGLLNVTYPNSASFTLDYTSYNEGFSIYNPSNDEQRLVASAFYPFNFWGLPFNVRASAFSRFRANTSSTNFRMDLNSRISKLNLRVGYTDRFTGSFDPFDPTSTAFLESSATYNFSRNRNLPVYLRGVFLRGQFRYQPSLNQVESAEVLLSQNIFEQGRLQLSYGRNFAGEYNTLRFNFVIDFDKVRNSTTYSNIRGAGNFTQNVRGSIGYDTNYDNFIFTSRDQVGRSGTAVKLFVDNNTDGDFGDEDDPIAGNALRIERSGATSTVKNGVIYYTNMQPYFFYNMELNKSLIQNPMLVPEFEKFGLITDPNRFKKVEVPFYMSGVVEGAVQRVLESGNTTGVAGLKLSMSKEDGSYTKELRTFSDGSFYDYEVPPGEYILQVDSTQLEILNVYSDPEEINFEVERSSDGDFVEGLSFLLVPTDMTREELQQIADASETTEQPESDTVGDDDETENIAAPDTSNTLALIEDQITEAVTDTLSNEEQAAADQDSVDVGLPPVITPVTPLPVTDLTDLDADSVLADSLPDTTISDPIADVTDEPAQIPASTITEIDELTDIPADSALEVIDESIDSETEGVVQPKDSLGVETDVPVEGGILPPVLTPVTPPILTATDLTDLKSDSVLADSLPGTTISEPIADVTDEPVQVPDSTTTKISDLTDIPADSAIAMTEGEIIQPADTTQGLVNRDSVEISTSDSTLAELQPDTKIPADSTDPDKDITDNEDMAVALPPVQNAADFIPPAFSSNKAFESLTPGTCIYGIQFASYSKQSQADDLSRRLEEEYLIFTIYNTPYELYALRELQYQSLARVTSATKELNTSYDFDAAVISQCYADLDLNPEITSYYIQIAEFATPEAAQSYLRDLEDTKGITATEIPGNMLGTRIGIGPFRSEKQASQRLRELSDDLDNSNNAIISRYVPPVKVADLSFEFMLLLDEFTTEEQAIAFVDETRNVFSLGTKILLDENKETYMVASELMKDWSRINDLKDRVLRSGISEEPVILMIEKKN